jgi:hypothetical protein
VHPFGYKHYFFSVISYRKIPFALYQMRIRKREPVAEIGGQYFAVVLGDDSKRCIAFLPQSTASAILTEVMLRLFDPDSPSYIGEAYYGKTPLRAPIHDSLLCEIPNRAWDHTVEVIVQEMRRPVPQLPLDWIPAYDRERWKLGNYLSIGVEAKQGTDWGTMKRIDLPEAGVSADTMKFPIDDDVANQEEFYAFGVGVA